MEVRGGSRLCGAGGVGPRGWWRVGSGVVPSDAAAEVDGQAIPMAPALLREGRPRAVHAEKIRLIRLNMPDGVR